MKVKRAIFAIIVIVIVLAFSISIFGSGLVTSCAAETEDTELAEEAEAVETPIAADAEASAPSVFIQSLKASMVVTDSDKTNADNIAKVVNVYNSLNKDSKIVDINGIVSADAVAKLTGAGIYYDDIDTETEAAAWALVTVDTEGVAVVG